MTGRRRVLAAIVIASLAALVLLLASGFRRDPRDIRAGSIGGPAPSFDLPLLDGTGRFRLADQVTEGKAVVVYYFASWCVPCKQEYPILVRVWERYRTSDVVIVGILFQDSAEAGLAFHRERGGTWPTVYDEGSRTALAFGVYGIPETYFIRPDGTIAGRQVGLVGEEVLVNGIEAIRGTGKAP